MARAKGKAAKGAAAAPKNHPRRPEAQEILPPGRPLNVLLVDDDATDRMIVRRAFKESRINPNVEEAIDIASGIAAIKRQAWDVVILDHVLPDGKSLDALREMRDYNIRMPVVVTTAYGDETLAVELLKAGAADYLSKDRITAETLTRAISHAIRVHKAEEELRKQDLLLQGAAQAATLLHTHADRLSVVNEALAMLGRATAADRAAVFENSLDPQTREPLMSHRFEWASDSAEFKFNDPELQGVRYQARGLGRWHAALSTGYTISGPVSSLPEAERKGLEARGIRSLVVVPISVGGKFWGFLKLEDRRAERVWSENEKSILSVTAAGIGSALVHRRADDALRQSEERYRAIVEEQVELICRMLPDLTIMFVNNAYCAFIGKRREELIGTNLLSHIPEALHEGVRAHMDYILREKKPSLFQHSTKSFGGGHGWVQWTGKAVTDAYGNVVEIQSVGHDVSPLKAAEEALRRSEEKYRAFVENLNVGVFRTSASHPGRFLEANPAHARMLGYSSPEEMKGLKIIDLYVDPHERQRLLEEMRNHGAVRDWPIHLKRKDGTPVTLALTATAHYAEDGRMDWLEGVVEDATERERAAHALKESKEYLDQIINLIPDPIFVKDREHRLILVNDAECALTGRPREQVLGKTDYEFFPKAQVDVFWAKDEEVFNSGRENVNEEQITDAAGVTRTIVTKKTLYVDPAGNRFIVGIIRDVTDRMRAQSALRRSEEQYRTLAEGSPDMIFMMDRDGTILYVNSMGARAHGREPRDLIGRKQQELFPPALAEQHAKAIRKVFDTGELHVNDVPERLGNSDIWMETRLVPVRNAQGQTTAVIGFARDITRRRAIEQALRESETSFRALAENATDGIFIIVGDGRCCAYVNRRGTEMSGYPAEELAAMDLTVLFRPEDAQVMLERYARRLKGEPVTNQYETEAVRKDGARVPLELSIAQTVWQREPATLVVARDITERRRIEEERRRLASSLLEVQEQERKQISAMLHDHLGQILTLTRLELGSVGGRDAESEKSIKNALQRLDEAIASVRRLAVSLRPPILDDLGLKAALESLTEEFADASSIATTLTCREPLPALTKEEETCLYRVLQEALTNAARHSGARKIEVLLRRDDGGTRLEVRDDGKGIDGEARLTQGGIGVIGMRERLARLGGRLQVGSEGGQGTTLVACIPARKTAGNESAP